MAYHSRIGFFWYHIKPYKWFYLAMLIGPFVSSLYPFSYNYALKLFLDGMTTIPNISYQDLLFPIVLFLATQIGLDIG
jgi:hypothetical protein